MWYRNSFRARHFLALNSINRQKLLTQTRFCHLQPLKWFDIKEFKEKLKCRVLIFRRNYALSAHFLFLLQERQIDQRLFSRKFVMCRKTDFSKQKKICAIFCSFLRRYMETSFCNCICYSRLVVCEDVNQATNKKFTYHAPFKNFSFLLAKRL